MTTSRAYFCRNCFSACVDDPRREPVLPSPFPGRPPLSLPDRAWLRDRSHRDVVLRVWELIAAAPRTITGGIGNLDGDDLDDAGLPEYIVGHYRDVTYADDGTRHVTIPASRVAHDLEALGLSRDTVVDGTAYSEPLACSRCRAPSPRRQRPPQSNVAWPTRATVPAVITMEATPHGR